MDIVTLERPPAQPDEATAAPATSRPTSRPSDIGVGFLQTLDRKGRHNLVAIYLDGRVEGRTFEPGAWAEIAAWIEARLSSANIYFSVNEPAPGAPHNKLAKGDLARIRCISIDLDPAPGELDVEREAILARLRAAVPDPVPLPSVVIDSGGGYQAHWVLEQSVPAATMGIWAENQSRAIAQLLGGDNTHNLDRVLRLPGTTNYPNSKKLALGRVTRQAKVLHQVGARYSPLHLSAAVQPLDNPAQHVTSDGTALSARIAAVQEELRHSGYDEADTYEDLPADIRSRLERDLLSSPALARLWGGELDDADQTGSQFRARLAILLARIGTYTAEDFARICYVWEYAVQPGDDRDAKLTERALARDWCRIAGPVLRRTEHLMKLAADGTGNSAAHDTPHAGEVLGAGVAPVPAVVRNPTPYSFPIPSEIPPRQFIYGKERVRGFISATVAPGGLGKSALTITETMAMATGRRLLGVPPKGALRCWYWNGEDPIDELNRRFTAVMLHHGLTRADVGDRLFVDSGRQMPLTIAVQGKEGAVIQAPVREALLNGLRERRIDALTIDPFISSHKVLENDNNAIDIVAKAWAALAEEADIAIELVHHVRKTNGAEVTVEDGRGAVALMNAARSMRALNRMTAEEAQKLGVTEDHRRLFRIGGDPKNNMAPPPATDDTRWLIFRSVMLGNGNADYPMGDDVGAIEIFKPVKSLAEIKEAHANTEGKLVAHAVLEAIAGETEVDLAMILPEVIGRVIAADVTKSSAPHVTRNKVTAALAIKGGMVLEHGGQLVRLEALRTSQSPKAPWKIRLSAAEEMVDASDARPGVFA